MEGKMLALKYHVEKFKDDVNDSWDLYQKAKNLKEAGDIEESRKFLNYSKDRSDYAEKEDQCIRDHINRNSIDVKENAYSSLYDDLVYRLDTLKRKIEKFHL